MKFDYNGVCGICGCGTTGRGDSRIQSDYEFCFGCGTRRWVQPKEDKNGDVLFSDGSIVMEEDKEQGFGTCLTKDNRLITFTKKPSDDRIKELKKEAVSLVLWNDKASWLDVIAGSPLMRKDVILLENDYSVKEYINEPEYPTKDEEVPVNVNSNLDKLSMDELMEMIPVDDDMLPVNDTEMPY